MTPALPPQETLTIEFKSDRNKLSDRDLIEAITCLANTDGGELWLGVEDDGTPTGLHPDHQMVEGVIGLVAARTSPALTVQVDRLTIQGVQVARILVPQAKGEVATSNGVYVRRRLRPDGTPECVPMLPHERTSRATTFGLLDASAQPVSGSTLQDFDPIERDRLRQAIQIYGGDRILLDLDDEALVISNPGGLVDGVTLANLLTTEPRPRNPRLADVMKRVGIVERSGRGIDNIYRGLLRYGRTAPDYSRTDSHNVVLSLSTAEADLEFLRLVVEEENKQTRPLPIDSLIALSALRESKRLSADELATRIQRDTHQARKTLEILNEAGLVQAHGITRSRTYTLAPNLYQAAGNKAEYTRQVGFSDLQNEQLVMNYVKQYGQIKRADVMQLCRLTKDPAARLLQKLYNDGRLVRQGKSRATFYVLAPPHT
jgi:predicted HTH transcriptional regulator